MTKLDHLPADAPAPAPEVTHVADLHDLVIQRLFAAGLELHRALRALPASPAAERIEAAIALLNDAVEQIRSTIITLDGP